MMAKDETEAARFKDGMRKAGFTVGMSAAFVDDMADALGCNRAGREIRSRIDALIAAKGNGPVDQAIIDEADDSVEPSREQVEVDLQAGPILTPTNEQSRWSEPADLPPARDYAVIDATDGTAVLVEILARFNNHTAARKICQKLNKEGG